jgi:hypothetical protein
LSAICSFGREVRNRVFFTILTVRLAAGLRNGACNVHDIAIEYCKYIRKFTVIVCLKTLNIMLKRVAKECSLHGNRLASLQTGIEPYRMSTDCKGILI